MNYITNETKLKEARGRGFTKDDMFHKYHLLRIESYFALDKLHHGLTDPDINVRNAFKIYLSRVADLGSAYKPNIQDFYLYLDRANK